MVISGWNETIKILINCFDPFSINLIELYKTSKMSFENKFKKIIVPWINIALLKLPVIKDMEG